jgi:two-component system CheB/CheR fusion protein
MKIEDHPKDLRGELAQVRALARRLACEVARAEARERARIARGLHDDLGQVLAMIKCRLGQLELSSGGQDARSLAELRTWVGEAIQATRLASFDLHAATLSERGLQGALEDLVLRLGRLGGPRMDLRLEATPDMPDDARAVLFRVLRELLFNVHKHARARHAIVKLRRRGMHLLAQVSDDGIGFKSPTGPLALDRDSCFGLASSEAQLRALGGGLSVRSDAGGGTLVQLWLPCSQPQCRAPATAASPTSRAARRRRAEAS